MQCALKYEHRSIWGNVKTEVRNQKLQHRQHFSIDISYLHKQLYFHFFKINKLTDSRGRSTSMYETKAHDEDSEADFVELATNANDFTLILPFDCQTVFRTARGSSSLSLMCGPGDSSDVLLTSGEAFHVSNTKNLKVWQPSGRSDG